MAFRKETVSRINKKLRKLLLDYPSRLYYAATLGHFPISSIIDRPLRIDGSRNIWIGEGVFVQYKTWLAAEPLTGLPNCELVIGDGAVIGHFNHIYATSSIVIERDALLADRVYISDNQHNYEDIEVPIRKQGVLQKGKVVIGAGCWIGENVSIIGASVGRQSVIGANSVVTRSIPDYCVAVGAPARVVKRYDFDKGIWRKVDSEGNIV
jgi:acetyltransferase-like isoleucine patch superfamily enzyme